MPRHPRYRELWVTDAFARIADIASQVCTVQQDHCGVHLSTPDGIVTGDAAVIAVSMAVLHPGRAGTRLADPSGCA